MGVNIVEANDPVNISRTERYALPGTSQTVRSPASP